ncbi:MAG: GNAT family N-acetyltransferase [Herpetosiphonaceae bacterium]|nr:GNAT family N-acetyltransferase [Herpetosiphonaceae bacterium]
MTDQTLVVRPAQPTDFPAVLRLIQQHYGADYGEPVISGSDLQDLWGRADLGQSTCLIERSQLLLAYAYVQARPQADGTTIRAALHTSPAARDQRLEALLLEQIERTAAGAAPRTIQATVTNSPARPALEERGYRLRIAFQTMTITLPPGYTAVVVPEQVAISPFMVGQDDEAAYQADEAASQDKGYAQPTPFDSWAARMLADPAMCFVARAGATIVGGVYVQRVVDEQVGIVQHLGVRREWRGRGIGRALLERAFTALAEAGISSVTLDVDAQSQTGADKLYAACGMRATGTRHIYEKQL